MNYENKDQEDRPKPPQTLEPVRDQAIPIPHNPQPSNMGHLEQTFASAAQNRVDKLNNEFESVQTEIFLLRLRSILLVRKSEVLDDFFRFTFCEACIHCEACVKRFPTLWNPRYYISNVDVIPMDLTPDCTCCLTCSVCAANGVRMGVLYLLLKN